jgi:hypothetical protein
MTPKIRFKACPQNLEKSQKLIKLNLKQRFGHYSLFLRLNSFFQSIKSSPKTLSRNPLKRSLKKLPKPTIHPKTSSQKNENFNPQISLI